MTNTNTITTSTAGGVGVVSPLTYDTVTTSGYTITTDNYYFDNNYNYNHMYDDVNRLTQQLINKIEDYTTKENNKTEKEEDMNIDFNFGSYNTDNIRLSQYGMAIKNKNNKWVSYDKETHRLIDVEIFNFKVNPAKIFFKFPKAIDKIVSGDIILHNNKPMFVETIREDGKFEVIDPTEGVAVTILPAISPFGFSFVTQIISLTDYMPDATKNNPFGNLLPLMFSEDSNMNSLLTMMMLKDDKDIDPMMLACLGGNNSLSAFMLMNILKKEKKLDK